MLIALVGQKYFYILLKLKAMQKKLFNYFTSWSVSLKIMSVDSY